jgi:uncharacterized protein (TIGR02284 family)
MFMERPEILGTPIPGEPITDTNKQLEIGWLNELIAANLGMTNLFETAAEQIEHEDYAQLLRDYAEQHQAFVTELSNLVSSFGGKPVTSSDSSNLIKQAWVAIKASLKLEESDILNEMAQGTENLLTKYGKMMPKKISDGSRDLIRKHMSYIRLTYQKLAALSASYNNS